MLFTRCSDEVSRYISKFTASKQPQQPRWLSNMLCRHVFGKISSEFRWISRVFVNFAGFRRFTWNSRLRDRAKYQKPCIKASLFSRVSMNKSRVVASVRQIETLASVIVCFNLQNFSFFEGRKWKSRAKYLNCIGREFNHIHCPSYFYMDITSVIFFLSMVLKSVDREAILKFNLLIIYMY